MGVVSRVTLRYAQGRHGIVTVMVMVAQEMVYVSRMSCIVVMGVL